MTPSAYAVNKRSRVLWQTMCFLNDRDPCGIRTRKWDRALIKSTVDRRKLILEHNAADAFGDFFEKQRLAIQAAGNSRVRMLAAVKSTRDDLEAVYQSVMLGVASSYGAWAASHLDAVAKASDPFKAPMLEWLRRFAAAKVADINATTRKAIQDILVAGTEAGDSIQEIARDIDDLYLDEIIPNRSLVIARTEVGNAANFASNEAAQSTGVPMEKTWMSLGDGFVRDAHADADGQTVEGEQDFIVGGEYLGWPGDTSKGASAGNVISCRCFLTWDVAA